MKANKMVGTSQSLSDIQPTNLEDLLSPFAGNEAFYRRLIAIFEKNLTQQLLDIQQLAEQGKVSELLVLIHTLKGTAGTAGLTSLHLALYDWERKLTELDGTTDNTAEYANLGQHITQLAQAELAQIHALLATSTHVDPIASTENASEALSLTQLTAELNTLKQHLLEANLNAVDYCQAVQAKLAKDSPFAPDVIALCQSIDELDFEGALSQLAALLVKMK